jgi:CubicO group peptidase (beta-lactamase class C family)
MKLGSVVLQGSQVAAEPVAHGYTAVGTSTLRDTSDGSPITPYTSVATAAWTAGGMAATAGDLATWARELYSGRVLDAATTRLMLTFVGTKIPGYSYGLGVQRIALLGSWSVGHGGRVQGFRAAMRHIPSRGITVVVLTNWDRADADRIAISLLRALEPWYPRTGVPPVGPSPSAGPTAGPGPSVPASTPGTSPAATTGP